MAAPMENRNPASAGGRSADKNGVISWRNKTEISKKTELIKEIHQLDIKVQNMEREKATHLYSKRSDFRKEFIQLEEIDLKIANELKTEKVKLSQQLMRIRSMVQKFHLELKDVKPTPEFVEKLKVIMEDIEGTINNFKESQRQKYEELMREERTTSQEISAIEKKLEAWAQAGPAIVEPTSARSRKPLTSARDVTKDLPPEVAAFERFLQQTGGHRGFWDEYDHQTFMKFRNKHKGKPLFIRDLVPALPTKTEAQIREHEGWYQEYLGLNERKKEAIQKWKAMKEQEKESAMAQAAEESSSDEEDGKLKLQQKIEKEKEERFAKLNAWKVHRELEKAQEEERQLREQLAKAQSKEKERQKQEEMRVMVDQYRQQKKEEEEFLRLEEEMQRQTEAQLKKRQLQKDKPRLEERNKKILEDKLSREKAKKQAETEKRKRLERLKGAVQVEVKRDPSRLTRPTEGWKERQKQQGSSSGGRVLHMPHRAVPGWRAGLN